MLKFLTLIILVLSSAAVANPAFERHVPNAQKVGEGRLTYLVWDVYDAILFAPAGRFENGKPMALKLSYLRDIRGKDIADTSAQKIRKLGFNDEIKLATWHAMMKNIFPDVNVGTEIIGVLDAKGQSHFYKDGDNIGTIQDPEFGEVFFSIWLGENTSIPSLRRQLLGQQG